MIQQVNLYQESLRRAPVLLPTEQLVQLLLGLVLALALLYAWGLFRYWNAASELAAREQERELLTGRLAELQERSSGMILNPALAATVAELDRELVGKRSLLSLLSTHTPGSTTGFSSHLEGLARQTVPGLWLRSFSIGEGSQTLTLEGRALDAELVPRLLDQLRSEPAFAGHQFHTFRMKGADVEQPWLEFRLSSVPPEAKP